MQNLSMFDEFKQTMKEFKRLRDIFGERSSNHVLPAMIILERKTTGENKHAVVGQPTDVFIAFEYGINQIAEDLGIDFKDALKCIEEIHNDTNHITLYKYKGDI